MHLLGQPNGCQLKIKLKKEKKKHQKGRRQINIFIYSTYIIKLNKFMFFSFFFFLTEGNYAHWWKTTALTNWTHLLCTAIFLFFFLVLFNSVCRC